MEQLRHRGPNGRSWTEHDFAIDYTQGIGDSDFSFSLGFINYAFPDLHDDDKFTSEFYYGISHDSILAPSFTIYTDIDDGSGAYYYAGIAPSAPVGDKGISFDPSFGIGVNQKLFWASTGVSDINMGIALSMPYKNVTFSPFFTAIYSPGDFGEEFGPRFKPLWGVSLSFEY